MLELVVEAIQAIIVARRTVCCVWWLNGALWLVLRLIRIAHEIPGAVPIIRLLRAPHLLLAGLVWEDWLRESRGSGGIGPALFRREVSVVVVETEVQMKTVGLII